MLGVVWERMSQTGSDNRSALSPYHHVEMSLTEIMSARTITPAWAPGVTTASLAGGICAVVISPPFLELTPLSCDFRQDLSLT